MKKNMKASRLGWLAIALVAAPSAMAQWQHGWYGGFSVGQSAATIDDERIIASLAAGRLGTLSISDDDRDTGYKLYFGRQFSRYLAMELGAFDLGEFGFRATTLPAGTFTGNVKVRGINLDLVGTLPISERLSAFARVGVNHAEAKASFTGTGLVRARQANASKRDTNYKAGVGMQYAFNSRLAVRAEYERYRIDDAVGNKGDIDLASVGLVYRFGGPDVPVRYASTPEPVAPAPRVMTPEPVAPPPASIPPRAIPQPPPPPPAPPPPMRVKFAADALFDFDKATLKPAGRQALDKFAADLRGVSIDSIVVIGHTDRIGSAAYNEKLSARRAEAVRAYLVETARLPAGKFTTRGAGESAPETKPGQCKGNTPSKPLVACLQPDRRVEVEVTGTRQ